jgi:hypothetical protein
VGKIRRCALCKPSGGGFAVNTAGIRTFLTNQPCSFMQQSAKVNIAAICKIVKTSGLAGGFMIAAPKTRRFFCLQDVRLKLFCAAGKPAVQNGIPSDDLAVSSPCKRRENLTY